MTMPTPFSALAIRHRVATSGLAGPVEKARGYLKRLKGLRHSELGLLSCEDDMIGAVMQRRLGRDWNCLDVGAHIGSVFYKMMQLAPDGQHAMIEASPGKAQMLRKRFGADRVHQVAVSNRNAEVPFYENLDKPGFSSLARRASRGQIKEMKVKAVRLDDLLGEATFDFIKIDVEGFEYPALQGGEALLRRCRPLIQFEAGAVDDPDLVDESAELYTWLTRDMGYNIYGTFDLYFDRPPIDAKQFQSYRTYPYLAFNYFAVNSDTPKS